MLRYFTYEEFDSPDVQGSGQMMSKDLILILESVREQLGKPVVNFRLSNSSTQPTDRWET